MSWVSDKWESVKNYVSPADIIFPGITVTGMAASDYYLGTDNLGLRPDVPSAPAPGEYNDIMLSKSWNNYIGRLADRKPTYSLERNTIGNYTEFVADNLAEDAATKLRAKVTPAPTSSPLSVDSSINI
jgi:hypothetical protein